MANLIDIKEYNKIVLDENKKIHTIIHISDIHIKNSYERKKEYEHVFCNLYEYLKKIKKLENSVTVITGDILDSYIEKNCNIDTKLFIENICKYTHCIIILGNHDISNGQKYNELSKLESVLYNLKTKNPFYLLIKDGYYEFKNIIFSLTSIFNKTVTPINSEKIKIGLYHGTLKEFGGNKHQYTNSGNFSINEFSDYDYVLLGDIHKRQIIKNGLYAGSLLQLDPLEEITKGGYLIDLKKRKVQEFNLDNDTGFYKITIDEKGNLKSNINIKKLPTNAKIIIENNNLNDETHIKYLTELKKKGVNIIDKKIMYKINNNFDQEVELLGNKYNLQSLKKKETILKIIKLYLTNEGKITDENKIKRILDKIENMININQKYMKHIKLNKLTIDNITVFGKNNILDFAILQKNKITNLYGTNDSGKTSLIECIMLALTGKSTKKGINCEFIHNKEKNGKLYLELEVNDDKYEIIRTYKKIDDSTYGKGELFVLKNGINVDYKENNKKNLEIYIETNICTLDELLTTSIIEQERNYSILLANNKLSAILKYIDMSVFDEIINFCKNDTKILIQKISDAVIEIKKNNTIDIIDENKINIDDILNNYQKTLNNLNKKMQEKTDIIKNTNNEILELEKEYIKIKTIININEDINIYNENLVLEKSKEHREKNNLLKNKKKNLIKLKKELKKVNNKLDINKIKNKLELCINNMSSDNNLKYNKIECEKLLEKKIKNLENLKNVHNYKTEEIINIVENYIKYQKNILLDEIKKKECDMLLDEYYNKINKNIIKDYEKLINYFNMDPINIQKNINAIENEITFLKNRIINIENNKKILEYREQIIKIEKKNNIKNEIKNLNLDICKLNIDIDNIYNLIIKENEKADTIVKFGEFIKKMEKIDKEKKLKQLRFQIEEIEIKNLNEKINKFNIEYGKITGHCEIHKLSIQKKTDNDIILTIMETLFIRDLVNNQILSIIENSANKILKYVGIDEIKINIKNIKHSMDVDIIRKDDKTNILRSGKFYYNCYDMILRMVFNKLNQTIKQDYLIIDEIMDGVSDKNKDKVIKILEYFKNYYDWTLIITHDENLRNYLEHSMYIVKENGYSKIL